MCLAFPECFSSSAIRFPGNRKQLFATCKIRAETPLEQINIKYVNLFISISTECKAASGAQQYKKSRLTSRLDRRKKTNQVEVCSSPYEVVTHDVHCWLSQTHARPSLAQPCMVSTSSRLMSHRIDT